MPNEVAFQPYRDSVVNESEPVPPSDWLPEPP